jgi:N6-adenosine-specific RNA methylase IME4
MVIADVPWRHENYGAKGHGAAKAHYEEVPREDLERMPVASLCHPDGALLALWCTGPQAADGAHVRLARAWGFELRTRLFAWVKCQRSCGACAHGWHDHEAGPVTGAVARGRCARADCRCEAFAVVAGFGPGSYTGSAVEDVWLGVRGSATWSSDRARRDVRQVVLAPQPGAHSAKPEEVQDRLEALWPGGTPRLELFARRRRAAWACWGGECPEPDMIFGSEVGAWWRASAPAEAGA